MTILYIIINNNNMSIGWSFTEKEKEYKYIDNDARDYIIDLVRSRKLYIKKKGIYLNLQLDYNLYCYKSGIKRIYNYINKNYNLDKYYDDWLIEEFDKLYDREKELAEKIKPKDYFTKDKYINFIYDEITKIYFNNRIDNGKYA
jgi:hypothetical protein